MGFMMLVFWGTIAALVVYVVRSTGHRTDTPPQSGTPAPDDALRVLDERFARGDIDADDYTRRRDLLRSR